jgi:hypothetical protein
MESAAKEPERAGVSPEEEPAAQDYPGDEAVREREDTIYPRADELDDEDFLPEEKQEKTITIIGRR